MSIKVKFSTPFREITGGKGEVISSGSSLSELLDSLDKTFPGFRKMIFGDGGKIVDHAHIFINGEDYRPLGGMAAALSDGDIVSLLFAIGGG